MSDNTRIEWTDATWNPVPDWPGFEVTPYGRIRGPSGKILKPMISDSGHLYVTRGRKSKKLYIHRAMLFTFIGSPQSDEESRHLNGNPADNRIENLAWGNRYAQRRDDHINGVWRGHNRALTAEDAVVIRVSHTTIQKIRRGERYG